MRRLTMLAVLAAVACNKSDIPQSLPHNEVIPANAVDIYAMYAGLLEYEYVDSTRIDSSLGGVTLRLSWVNNDPNRQFTGYNCLAFTPRTPTDTVGTFVFVARGPNAGWLERTTSLLTDTIPGFFLAGHEGSRGTYSVNSQGALTLLWHNGTQTDYFDPTAQLRKTGDSVISDVTISIRGDSISGRWHVAWVRDICPD